MNPSTDSVMCQSTSGREVALAIDQPELERLSQIVADGPMLDQLAFVDPPDVDLLGRELLAAGRLPQELADVAAVHDDSRDNLVSLADLILDVESHRPPKPAEPHDRLLETVRPLRA